MSYYRCWQHPKINHRKTSDRFVNVRPGVQSTGLQSSNLPNFWFRFKMKLRCLKFCGCLKFYEFVGRIAAMPLLFTLCNQLMLKGASVPIIQCRRNISVGTVWKKFNKSPLWNLQPATIVSINVRRNHWHLFEKKALQASYWNGIFHWVQWRWIYSRIQSK